MAESHFFWYLARAAGLCAYVFLALDVSLGLSVRTRLLDRLSARWRIFDLHQFTGLLVLAFLALHVFSLLGDQYVGFSLSQLFVPFASAYRPFWTALGVLALYLVGAIVASFYVRRHIGYRAWRTLHYFTFVAFVLALLHGVFAGTDGATPWALVLYGGTGTLIGGLMLWRFNREEEPVSRRRPQRAGTSTTQSALRSAI